MLRFAANLSLLFTEWPLAERFQAAKQSGFQAVEIQFPYELPAEEIRVLLERHELKLVLFNVAADELLQGGEGLAAVPEKQAEFRAAVELAALYARALKPDCINVLPGRCLTTQRRDEYLQTFKSNLRHAADTFSALGVTTVFEAINTHDMPGFIIDSQDSMLAVLADLQHPGIKLQFDIYHMCKMQQDFKTFLRLHLDTIGHIQFADCPGRGQPGTGTIDFSGLFDWLAASDFAGWVGAEYKPQPSTTDSLGWMTR